MVSLEEEPIRLLSETSISECALKCMVAEIWSGGRNMHQILLASVRPIHSLVLQPIASSHIPLLCSSTTYASWPSMLSLSSAPPSSQHHDLTNENRQKYGNFQPRTRKALLIQAKSCSATLPLNNSPRQGTSSCSLISKGSQTREPITSNFVPQPCSSSPPLTLHDHHC